MVLWLKCWTPVLKLVGSNSSECYYVHFQTKTFEKDMKPLISQAMS